MAIFFGLLLLVFGAFTIWRSINLRINGVFTIGTVTKIRIARRAPTVIVTFKTLKNKKIVFQAGGWTAINTSPFYQIGNPVPVLYDPNNPSNAVIYTFDFMWLLPLAFLGGGFFFIYQGIVHL